MSAFVAKHTPSLLKSAYGRFFENRYHDYRAFGFEYSARLIFAYAFGEVQGGKGFCESFGALGVAKGFAGLANDIFDLAEEVVEDWEKYSLQPFVTEVLTTAKVEQFDGFEESVAAGCTVDGGVEFRKLLYVGRCAVESSTASRFEHLNGI